MLARAAAAARPAGPPPTTRIGVGHGSSRNRDVARTRRDHPARVVEILLLAGLHLVEIGDELGLLRLPVDAELLHQRLGRRRMPVRLHDLVGMRAAHQRSELAVGENRQIDFLAHRLADPLVLVERRDAAGVVADHHVGMRLVDRDADLAVDRERAGEFALGNDVAEAEAAAVVPRRVVDHLRAERLHQPGRHRDAIAVQHGVVVDHVLRHHLVDVARRVDGGANLAAIDLLQSRDRARASRAATRSSGRPPRGSAACRRRAARACRGSCARARAASPNAAGSRALPCNCRTKCRNGPADSNNLQAGPAPSRPRRPDGSCAGTRRTGFRGCRCPNRGSSTPCRRSDRSRRGTRCSRRFISHSSDAG